MNNYTLADFVSRLNIASRGHLKSIRVQYTGLTLEILIVLYRNGIIRGFRINGIFIYVFLKYYQNRFTYFRIELVSRPGHRIRWSLGRLSLEYNSNNFGGFYIISTSKGILTSNSCLLGGRISGEVLLKVII